MARWTVVDGEQELVIESAGTGLIALDVLVPPFVTGPDGLKEIRAKLSLAIGEAQAELSAHDDDGKHGNSRGGEQP